MEYRERDLETERKTKSLCHFGRPGLGKDYKEICKTECSEAKCFGARVLVLG